MPKKRFTVDQVIDALLRGDGKASQAAELLGCTARTIYNYRDSFPTVRQTWDEINDKSVDFVENELMRQIRGGNVTAMIFFLKANPAAKARGWGERTEHTGGGGGPITVVSWDASDDSD